MNRAYRRSTTSRILFVVLLAFLPVYLHAVQEAAPLTWDQQEQFLLTAQIVKTDPVAKGITNTVRVTLSDGTLTHDASVQRINESKAFFKPDFGPAEMNFKDSYKFNIAAWKLARMLGIGNMMPPSVERKYQGAAAAFTWWIDNVMMEEGDRQKKKLTAPNTENWNREMNVLLVFDQLIYNTDRNIGNIIIDKQWHLWMIDHTRAFRLQKTLRTPNVLGFSDRGLLARMKALDEPTLEKELTTYLTKEEIRGLLARRDLIVKFFEAKGERFLYDRPARN